MLEWDLDQPVSQVHEELREVKKRRKKRQKKRPPKRFPHSLPPEMDRYLSTLVALERLLEPEELEAATGNLDKIDREWSHRLTVKLRHPDRAVRAVVAQLLRHRNDRSILTDLEKVFDTPDLPPDIKLEVAALLNDFGLTFDLDHLKTMLEEPEKEAKELLKTIRRSIRAHYPTCHSERPKGAKNLVARLPFALVTTRFFALRMTPFEGA